MSGFVSQCLSDGHGQPDEQALISIVGAAVFFGLEIYAVAWHGQNFDAFGFGAGFGALLGATSAGFGLRTRWSGDESGLVNSGPDCESETPADIDPVTGRYLGEHHAGISG